VDDFPVFPSRSTGSVEAIFSSSIDLVLPVSPLSPKSVSCGRDVTFVPLLPWANSSSPAFFPLSLPPPAAFETIEIYSFLISFFFVVSIRLPFRVDFRRHFYRPAEFLDRPLEFCLSVLSHGPLGIIFLQIPLSPYRPPPSHLRKCDDSSTPSIVLFLDYPDLFSPSGLQPIFAELFPRFFDCSADHFQTGALKSF